MFNGFQLLKGRSAAYSIALVVLSSLAITGIAAAHYMDVNGHWVTGMNNQVVWGLPHVFAIGLILAASGALNVASLHSVFNRDAYKPWARLSGLVSLGALVGGLLILVLDLGRPERLIIAMTHYNFQSIFAWNIFLYSGFALIVVAYLWTMFEPRQQVHTPRVGWLALGWRLVLTAGTGSIFGFIVARELFDSAMMVPIFIMLSLLLGSAIFILIAWLCNRWCIGDNAMADSWYSLGRLLGMFIAVQLFLVATHHLTALYAAEHWGVMRFILIDGAHITALFWLGYIMLGGVAPLLLLFSSEGKSAGKLVAASGLAIAGNLAQLYVIIIGGQLYPQLLFPGKTVSSTFFDGQVANYLPRLPELLLGLGGVALALLFIIIGARILPFYPRTAD